MQTINLINPEKGNVNFEVIKFPDGQVHLKITSEINRKETETRVQCRICNAEDLFLLTQVLDVLNRHGIEPTVYIYYLMGARMDRIMSFNEPFTLDIIANILNGFKAKYEIVEPHNMDIIERKYGWNSFHYCHNTTGSIVCYPDEGAMKRYSRGTSFDSVKKDIIYCSKKRDRLTGKLSGFEINCNQIDIKDKDVIVLDDLIDGGRTFCGIAPLIREKGVRTLSIMACHAVQKEGIERVAALYDKVRITNSYFSWDSVELPKNVEVIDAVNRD